MCESQKQKLSPLLLALDYVRTFFFSLIKHYYDVAIYVKLKRLITRYIVLDICKVPL